MPTIASSRIPLPNSPEEFEDITLSAARSRWSSPDFFKNGRRGQRQKGVDIFGEIGEGRRIGIQCKHTPGGLAFSVVQEEVASAEAFAPPLTVLYIATSARPNAVLQEQVRVLSAARQEAGRFAVRLLFWDALASDLARDEVEFFKHYPQFRPTTPDTHAAGSEVAVYFIEDLDVKRHAAFGGKSLSMKQVQAFGLIVGPIGLIGVLLTVFRPLEPGIPGWISPVAIFSFVFGAMAFVFPPVLKRRKFEHLFLNRYFVEASRDERLYVNQFTATCPSCGSPMRLWHVGPKGGPYDDIFVCERVPAQHRIRLDPSALSEIDM